VNAAQRRRARKPETPSRFVAPRLPCPRAGLRYFENSAPAGRIPDPHRR